MRGRLGDFGLAKLYQQGQVPNTTPLVGKLGYLAPEAATAAAPTSVSDVYSFGVVLLEWLVGGGCWRQMWWWRKLCLLIG